MSEAPALELRGIDKRFGATHALRGASVAVRRGTVHALLGENGAGKTTLMRIAFGAIAPDAGTLLRNGVEVRWRSSADAIASRIGMVHQHFMLVPAFTVTENAALGLPHYDRRAVVERIRELGASAGIVVDPDAVVRDLSVGVQQRAEIVRALVHDASLLILDEPTAVLSPSEGEELYRWIRAFVGRGGTVVLITHRLADALAVADEITVLRRGEAVLARARAAVSEDELVEAVVGAMEPQAAMPLAARSEGEIIFALDRASVVDARGVVRLAPTTLEVRAGEVLGVIGVEGSGYRELLRLLAGRTSPNAGTVRRPARVGFVPEDRLHEAIIPSFSLTENVALANLAEQRGLMPWDRIAAKAADIVRAFAVQSGGVSAAAAALSGGNQQRFVVGRERVAAPEALVAENPTRGLDLRAAEQVRSAIRSSCAGGRGAAVVYSSDIEEVLALTSRIVACAGGRVTEVAPPTDRSDQTPYARAIVGLSP